MRKVFLLAAAFLVVAGLPPVATASPNARAERIATAFWRLPTNTKHEYIGYSAFAWTSESVGGSGPSFAGVARSRCREERSPHSISVTCSGGDFVSGDPSKVFEMSPDGSEAHLKITKDGHTQEVSWAGDPIPTGEYFAEESCGGDGHGYGGGVAREARATGTIFGHKLTKGHADLEMGAMVTQCDWSPVLRFDRRGVLRGYSFTIPRREN